MADAQAVVGKNPGFIAAYLREAEALQELDRVEEALKLLEGLPPPQNESPEVRELVAVLKRDYAEDHLLPQGQ